MARRRILTYAAVALGALGLAMSAPVSAQSLPLVNSNVIENNYQSFTQEFGAGLFVLQSPASSLSAQNAAVASTQCFACQSVAISLQLVMLTNTAPNLVSSNDIANAINNGCNSCGTLGVAVQNVIVTGGPAWFTPAGNAALDQIRVGLLALKGQTPANIVAGVQAAEQALLGVISNPNDLVSTSPALQVGPPGFHVASAGTLSQSNMH